MLFQISPLVNGTPVRFDAQDRYCLNDLHQAAGGLSKDQPSNFLRLDQTQALIQELDSNSSDLRSFQSCVYQKTGRNGGTYVSRLVVYAYASWVSPKFHVQVLQTFDTAVLMAQQRVESKASFKAVSEAINQATLTRKGEVALPRHYMNENKLLHRLSLGQSKEDFCKEHGIGPKHFRDWLAVNAPLALEKLDFLSKHDETLLGLGMAYDQRKEALSKLLETRFKSKFPALDQQAAVQAQTKLNRA